jgi:hypothetical protein
MKRPKRASRHQVGGGLAVEGAEDDRAAAEADAAAAGVGPDDVLIAVAASGTGSAVADLKLWPWLILFALLFVMVEWFIYNRKVYV